MNEPSEHLWQHSFRIDREQQTLRALTLPEQFSEWLSQVAVGDAVRCREAMHQLGLTERQIAISIAKRCQLEPPCNPTALMNGFDIGPKQICEYLAAAKLVHLLPKMLNLAPREFQEYQAWVDFKVAGIEQPKGEAAIDERAFLTTVAYDPRSGAEPVAQTQRTIGNRYRLHRLLGEGGQSVVWAAIDLQTGRKLL